MTLNKGSGFALPEVLIASAIFSVGMLGLLKLNSVSALSLLTLFEVEVHANTLARLSTSLTMRPLSKPEVLVQLNTAPMFTGHFSEHPLPPPLYMAEISTVGALTIRPAQQAVIKSREMGSWNDIASFEASFRQ